MQARFGPFTFHEATREVRRGGERVHLSPKAFELLALLLRRQPNAVSKADIHHRLWPDTFVSDGAVAVIVAEIRRALGDSGRQPAFIRTVNRFGYAFVGEIVPRADSGPGVSGSVAWLIRGHERFRLHSGENILGRDLSADIPIDAVGVSRRHAVIDVGETIATLRDLSSKNGTFLEGVRVTAPVTLLDSMEVRLGGVALQFRHLPLTPSTQTVEDPQTLRGPS